jgi:hypothetical protein
MFISQPMRLKLTPNVFAKKQRRQINPVPRLSEPAYRTPRLQSPQKSFAGECLLWVISGHVGLHEKESALLLKADILRGGYNSQLSAISRLLHHLMVDQLECIW